MNAGQLWKVIRDISQAQEVADLNPSVWWWEGNFINWSQCCFQERNAEEGVGSRENSLFFQ